MTERKPITADLRRWWELHCRTLATPELDEGLDALCDAVDAVHARLEREAEGTGGPVPAEVVSDGSTDGATGYCRCGACHGSIDPWDRYCRHCGTGVGA